MKIWIHEAGLKDIDLDDLHTSLSYFDVLNFADRIDVPVFLRTQEVDTITPKEGTIKLFESIKGNKKNLYVEPCEGHGCSSVSQLANELERIFIEKNLLKN